MNEHIDRAMAILHTHKTIRSFRDLQGDLREACRDRECTGVHAESLMAISKGVDDAIDRIERFLRARGLPPEPGSQAALDASEAAFAKAREEAGGGQ